MYVSDVIIPRLIARKHRRENGRSPENLIRAAKGYKHRLEAFYSTRALRIIRRNLYFLKKRIAPLDIDHQNFLDAIEYRITEIHNMEGVSEQNKIILINKAKTADLHVIEKNDKKIELVWDKIIKPKNSICNQANDRISGNHHKIQCLGAAFKLQFENYKTILTKQLNIPEVEQMKLDLPSLKLVSWDYKNPKSIPDDEYIIGED